MFIYDFVKENFRIDALKNTNQCFLQISKMNDGNINFYLFF